VTDSVPKEYHRVGSIIVPLEATSKVLGGQWFAQVRPLTGNHWKVLFDVSVSGSELFAEAQKDGASREVAERAASVAFDKARTILTPSVFRAISLTDGGKWESYRVTPSTIGEHEANEVSLDALLPDFMNLAMKVMEMSKLTYGGEGVAAPPFRSQDSGLPGPSGTEVRSAPEHPA